MPICPVPVAGDGFLYRSPFPGVPVLGYTGAAATGAAEAGAGEVVF